jgi:hypothetical protein
VPSVRPHFYPTLLYGSKSPRARCIFSAVSPMSCHGCC